MKTKTTDEFNSVFEMASKPPSTSEVFAKETHPDVSPQDIFAGDEQLHKIIERSRNTFSSRLERGVKDTSKALTATHIILIANILVITIVLTFMMLKGPTVVVTAGGNLEQTGVAESQKHDILQQRLTEQTTAMLDKATSWQVAERLYNNQQYLKAYYMYGKLSDNLTTSLPADAFLKDLLSLKRAMCLLDSEQQDQAGELFSRALRSRSPVVRALANYYMCFVEMKNRHFEELRIRAYKTLALLESIRESFPLNLEADCYFMIGEALTKKTLMLGNLDMDLPGRMWADSIKPYPLPPMTHQELRSFLQKGLYHISEGALTPQIAQNPTFTAGTRWSAVCFDAPLEEIMARFGSEAGKSVQWSVSIKDRKTLPVTMYMPGTGQQIIPEVATGSVGLISQFSTNGISIVNPDFDEGIDMNRTMFAREGIYVWRRFLLRYRGDHRTPNAHYSMALLQENIGQTIAAMGEYRLIVSQYAHNELAPYALLNSSKIKTAMRDYKSAQEDLTELSIQYPDSKVIDQASLYLAEAKLSAGSYDEALKLFRKVYNLNVGSDSQLSASYGIGRCSFLTGKYSETRKWLTYAINHTENPIDHRLVPSYLMLGRALIELKDYQQASNVLQNALGAKLSVEEYVEVILQLVESERSQGKYLMALNMVDSVSLDSLPQNHATRMMVAKAQILRDIGLTEAAITLLRPKIEFIADSSLRAILTLELSKCFIEKGDLRVALVKLSEALPALPVGSTANEARLLLAHVSLELGQLDRARDICLKFLSTDDYSNEDKNKAVNLLGKVYTRLNQHDKAALAYAGILDAKGIKN